MYDTHCHLTFKQFRDRVDAVLESAQQAGVQGCITVGTTPEDSAAALKLAQTYDNVWCSAGMHPLYANEPRDWAKLREVALDEKCVAWGELGLDNHYDDPPRTLQDEVLAGHLACIESWENQMGRRKPIIVHCRNAFDELLAVFRESPFEGDRFVFHCFTGGPDEARMVLDFGAWISFTGVVTFRNAKEVAEAARLVPADRIMVETDAPFLAPEPMRKVFPNEPQYVVHTARYLAELRGVSAEEFERVLDANAERFFGIGVERE